MHSAMTTKPRMKLKFKLKPQPQNQALESQMTKGLLLQRLNYALACRHLDDPERTAPTEGRLIEFVTSHSTKGRTLGTIVLHKDFGPYTYRQYKINKFFLSTYFKLFKKPIKKALK